MKKILLVSIIISFISCSQPNKNQEMGERFFEIYSKRKELDKMLSFYSKDFEYENVNFESETDDPKFLYEDFYGWKDANFQFSDPNTVKVEKLIANENSIVAKGTTVPYVYNGKQVEGTRFVIWLELDKNHKIVKQTDWFDYPMEEIIEAFYLKKNLKIE